MSRTRIAILIGLALFGAAAIRAIWLMARNESRAAVTPATVDFATLSLYRRLAAKAGDWPVQVAKRSTCRPGTLISGPREISETA